VTMWISSFAQAFANDSLLSIHSHNFGLPYPAPIAFGLSAAYPQAVLIFIGMHPADAYSAIAGAWLSFAFWGAYRLARRHDVEFGLALLLAVFWITVPMIWAHAAYATLSLGIALIPLYILATDTLMDTGISRSAKLIRSTAYFLLAVAAVFMDGYSFIMFFIAAAITLLVRFTKSATKRSHLVFFTAPVMATSFAACYFLYRLYVGKLPLEPESLDVFRGWGVDLSFLIWPTQGSNLVADAIGLGAPRTTANYFGDTSVWESTFMLPTLGLGFWAWLKLRKTHEITHLTIIALFAMYMAMGPSVKILSERIPGAPAERIYGAMPVTFARMRTGSSIISRLVPGLNNMRASYRWGALGSGALWLMFVTYAGTRAPRKSSVVYLIVTAATLLNLPHIVDRFKMGVAARDTLVQAEEQLGKDLRGGVNKEELIAFLPFRNDFAIGYVVAREGLHSFNAAGDKNLMLAVKHWPSILKMFAVDTMDASFTDRIMLILFNRQVDVVAIPRADGPWGDHFWPCVTSSLDQSSPNAPTTCGDGADAAVAKVIETLRNDTHFVIDSREYFWLIRISPDYRSKARIEAELQAAAAKKVTYPVTFGSRSGASAWLLESGWYQPEAEWTWSEASATLALPRPPGCTSCSVNLLLMVFGASMQRHVHVKLRANQDKNVWVQDLDITSSNRFSVPVPFPEGESTMRISLAVDNAVSPHTLVDADDFRVLGVALSEVTVLNGSASDPEPETPKTAPKTAPKTEKK
jgi:hypothetical protein